MRVLRHNGELRTLWLQTLSNRWSVEFLRGDRAYPTLRRLWHANLQHRRRVERMSRKWEQPKLSLLRGSDLQLTGPVGCLPRDCADEAMYWRRNPDVYRQRQLEFLYVLLMRRGRNGTNQGESVPASCDWSVRGLKPRARRVSVAPWTLNSARSFDLHREACSRLAEVDGRESLPAARDSR